MLHNLFYANARVRMVLQKQTRVRGSSPALKRTADTGNRTSGPATDPGSHSDLTITACVIEIATKCAQMQYAPRIMRAHVTGYTIMQHILTSSGQSLLPGSCAPPAPGTVWSKHHTGGELTPCLTLQSGSTTVRLSANYVDNLMSNCSRVLSDTTHVLYSLSPPPSTASQHYKPWT